MDAYCDTPKPVRVFVSGPLSNGEEADERTRERNVKHALAFTELLESNGFQVFCPHRELREFATTHSYREIMERCFRELRQCQAILFLKDWELSKGCHWEAKYLSMVNHILPQRIEPYEDAGELLRAFP